MLRSKIFLTQVCQNDASRIHVLYILHHSIHFPLSNATINGTWSLSIYKRERISEHTLHLSHKGGSNSSELKVFCSLLYIIFMDLSTCKQESVYKCAEELDCRFQNKNLIRKQDILSANNHKKKKQERTGKIMWECKVEPWKEKPNLRIKDTFSWNETSEGCLSKNFLFFFLEGLNLANRFCRNSPGNQETCGSRGAVVPEINWILTPSWDLFLTVQAEKESVHIKASVRQNKRKKRYHAIISLSYLTMTKRELCSKGKQGVKPTRGWCHQNSSVFNTRSTQNSSASFTQMIHKITSITWTILSIMRCKYRNNKLVLVHSSKFSPKARKP